MDHLLLLRICCFFLVLSPCVLCAKRESLCPLDSGVDVLSRGCDVCHCCRYLNGDYHVICNGGSAEIPPLPPATTSLQLTSGEVLRRVKDLQTLDVRTAKELFKQHGSMHLTRNSFPELPHLTHLHLLRVKDDVPPNLLDSAPATPVVSAAEDAFFNLPELSSLNLNIKLDTVTSFLSSAPKLRQLNVTCMNDMTNDDFKILFRGLHLTSLTATSCTVALDHRFPLDTRPDQMEFVGMVPAGQNLVLPGSDVKIRCHEGSFRPCFNIGEVQAKSLSLEMTMSVMSIFIDRDLAKSSSVSRNLLAWVDSGTNVSLYINNIFGYDVFGSIGRKTFAFLPNILGNHSFHSLSLSFAPISSNEDTPIPDLLKTIESVAVRHLFLRGQIELAEASKLLGAAFLSRLIGPHLSELELTGFPIGRIDDTLEINVTKFRCSTCRLECHNCRFSEALQELKITNNGGTYFMIDIKEMVSSHPKLEELVIMDSDVVIVTDSLLLPPHHHLRRLEIHGSLKTMTENLDVSHVDNLETLLYRGAVSGDAAPISVFQLRKLASIDFSYSFFNIPFKSSILKSMFVELESLKELWLPRQVSTPFWGTVEGLNDLLFPVSSTLETLDISKNQISYLPSRMFSLMYRLKELYLSESNLTNLPAGIFSSLHSLRKLDLSKNTLTTLDGCAFSNEIALSQVILSDNKLEVISRKSVTCLTQMGYFRMLLLDGNRLKCVCENRKLRDWILNAYIAFEVKFGSHDLSNSIPFREVCPGTDILFKDFVVPWMDCDFRREGLAIGAFALILIVITAAAYVIYYFRYDIIFWWVVKRRHKVNKQRSVHPSKEFHAFLSYDSSEQDLAHSMFFELEDGKDVQFKIAYDCRDFLPLYDIADNIIRCIDRSEKVIFLISRRFLERQWCQYELDFAQMRCFDERKNLIILIFVEKIPMKDLPKRIQLLCRHVNYMEYPDEADTRAVHNFWRRLRLALAQNSELETETGGSAQEMGGLHGGIDNEFADLEKEDYI